MLLWNLALISESRMVPSLSIVLSCSILQDNSVVQHYKGPKAGEELQEKSCRRRVALGENFDKPCLCYSSILNWNTKKKGVA